MRWGSLINTVSLVALGLAALAAITGSFALPGGYRLYSVLTGSMEPALSPGSLVVVKRVADVGNVAVGDVVSFQQPGQPNMIITHRVSAIDSVGGATFLKTKGDANSAPDPWRLSYGHLVGSVVWSAPIIGSVFTALHTPWAIALLVWVPVLLLAFHELFQIHTILMELQLERKKAAA
ncbi:signal peptidase I [Candidatus Berkelbacteria bacterium]|nr:signal peptidase I [Candidatus Berkelbacteria bacterium]